MSDARNREDWLTTMVEAVRPWFEEMGRGVPEVRASVGWPSRGGTGKRKRVVGECWERKAASDGVNQIFISPVRGAEESAEAIGTLIHEIVHAIDDCESGHKGDFVTMARDIGLIRPWTQTTMSEELRERVDGLVERYGPMPHAALSTGGGADAPPKQSTRQLKAECVNGTGYKVRLTQKWIDEYGAPICACCEVAMEVEEK